MQTDRSVAALHQVLSEIEVAASVKLGVQEVEVVSNRMLAFVRRRGAICAVIVVDQR